MYRIWYKIEDWYREIKFAYQRVVRGYDDTAVWGLCDYIADIAVPVIDEMLKNEGVGAPVHLTNKEWKKILKDIRDNLLADEFANCKFSKKTWDKKRKAAELLGKHFWSLWT